MARLKSLYDADRNKALSIPARPSPTDSVLWGSNSESTYFRQARNLLIRLPLPQRELAVQWLWHWRLGEALLQGNLPTKSII